MLTLNDINLLKEIMPNHINVHPNVSIHGISCERIYKNWLFWENNNSGEINNYLKKYKKGN